MKLKNFSFTGIVALLFICIAAFNTPLNQTASTIPVQLECENRTNPIGLDTSYFRLAWKLKPADAAARNLSQTAYQILAASSPALLQNNKGDLWNTGKVVSNQTDNIPYAGRRLKSHQTVYWKVRSWDGMGNVSSWSAVNKWTMGILSKEDWQNAKWVGAPEKLDSAVNSTFLLRREFGVKPNLKRAIISVCGLGQYEMTINGKQLTETILNPGWTQYDKTCLYNTFDITSLMKNGRNAIGLLLSNGMYRVKHGGRYAKLENSFGRLQAIAKIEFEYADGSVQELVTDEIWKAGESPMIWSSIYGGEDWDARKLKKGWDQPGFNEAGWLPAEIRNGPGGELKGITHAAPPIKQFQVFKPISRKEIKPHVFIYDLGQNASFISRITVSGPAGSIIKITPGELLNEDGSLFRNNYNGQSYSRYILAGTGKEQYTSKFFTTGCRYYQVECLAAPGHNEIPELQSIEGIFVHSDVPFTGSFSCSNQLFNRIFKMVQWAELSNMTSVISDCPHRERLGWLEQTHLHAPSFFYNYDMRQQFAKTIDDMNDTQQPDGLIPSIAPELTVFGGVWREPIEWGSAGILLPWQLYQWTGDVEILKKNYSMMKRYVGFITGKAKNGIAAEGLGDWSGRWASPHTPKDLVATAFYYADADVLAKSAKLLGHSDESLVYEKLAQSICKAFNQKFFNAQTNQYGRGSQSANAMALVMGLVDSGNKEAVLHNLVADIENSKYENTTGEIGFRYVLRALADGGRSDVIYKMNNQDERPGYGYQLKMGATALPETWDAFKDNSQNHFMLGHIIEWFYHDLAGIQTGILKDGRTGFIIRPSIVNGLKEVKADYNSIHGKITSEWKLNGNKLTMHVVVPPNAGAMVYIPAANGTLVRESGKPLTQMQGGKLTGIGNGYAMVNLASGDYLFETSLTENF